MAGKLKIRFQPSVNGKYLNYLISRKLGLMKDVPTQPRQRKHCWDHCQKSEALTDCEGAVFLGAFKKQGACFSCKLVLTLRQYAVERRKRDETKYFWHRVLSFMCLPNFTNAESEGGFFALCNSVAHWSWTNPDS